MERRVHRRFLRRVEVRFWRRGDAQSHSSFTTNISRTGIFLGSASALQPGERLRLEVVDPERGFIVEGRVARVHRVSVALRHIEQPGVGVRFLPPEELIEEFLPMLARQAEPLRAATAGPSIDYGPAFDSGPAASAPERATEAPPSAAPSAGATYAATAAAEAAEAAENRAQAAADSGKKIIPVQFDDASTFLSVFHRDIQSGGLFVSSAEPAQLNEVVLVELRLPLPDVRPELIQARVVQRFEPKAAVGSGRNALAGMALQFLDPERVVTTLKPLLGRIRGS